MSNGTSRNQSSWRAFRQWLLPLLGFLILAGALLYMFLSMRQTVWCYFTDDISINESALTAAPRLIIWEEPHRTLGATSPSELAQRPAFSPDGATMVFSSRPAAITNEITKSVTAAATNTSLYASTWDGKMWSSPEPIETNSPVANAKDPAISPNGQYLYFSSDRPDGHGGYDIWIARWDGEQWGAITNAGPAINSANDDAAPAVSPNGDRLYFSSNRPPGQGFDILVADIWMPVATTNIATGTTLVDSNAVAAALFGAAPKSTFLTQPKRKAKSPAVKSTIPSVSLPEFANVHPVTALNSPSDDLNVSFTARGDFAYFDSNRKGGLGGADLYISQIKQGEFQQPKNLKKEINTTADDLAPAVRMEGFDLAFSSNRRTDAATNNFNLYSATAREVVSRLDLSRLELFLSRLLAVKWWILALIAAIILLYYLITHFRDLTDLFHKCLMASAIIHVLALLIVASWKIGSKMSEKSLPTNTVVEIGINVNAMAREKLAADLAENVTGRSGGGGGGGGGDGTPQAPSEITVVARQADGFVPTADFVPQQTTPHVTTVARSTTGPTPLEDAPSRSQASASSGDTVATVKGPTVVQSPAQKLETLPVVVEAAPRVDVVMEDRAVEGKVATANSAFQPLLNVPTVSTNRVQYVVGAGVVSSVAPLNIVVGVAAIPVSTNTGGSEKISLAMGSGTGDGAVETRDTGGSFARASGGGDVSSGPRGLSGPGETIASRLASAGSGTGRGTGTGPGSGTGSGGGLGSGQGTGVGSGTGPGFGSGSGGGEGSGIGTLNSMEVPQGFGTSPYQLRKGGKPSAAVVEGLGGSPGTETAVGNALAWLAAHQEPDGHWDTAKYGGAGGHDNAITGFALLTFLGSGIQHNQPGAKYQPVVAKAIEWLLAQVKPDGDIRGQGGTMYDQGIASAAIAEAFGLSKDPKLAATVSNVTSFIVKAQNKESGGWRYAPGDRGDTSVFGWQVMALKSAELAGIKVTASTYELADKWLVSVSAGEKGGMYGYESKNATPAMTAEGMFCHQLMGSKPDDPRMQESAGYVGANIPDSKAVEVYYWYYGTLAMYQHRGPAWEPWNARMKEGLLATQVKDGADTGSWSPVGQWGGACGRVGSTAMSALILEVYYRYLPMYSSAQPNSGTLPKPTPKK